MLEDSDMKESAMRTYFAKSMLTLACLTLLSVPMPVTAQSSNIGLSIGVNPTSTTPGSMVGVFSMVVNNSAKELRTTVTFTSLSPCGIQTSLGYHKLDLMPGQTIMVTVSYPIPPDACKGQYAVSISASTPGKKSDTAAASVSSTAYLMVE